VVRHTYILSSSSYELIVLSLYFFILILIMARAGGESNDSIFKLSYSLGSIPSGTGRLYCQDVARRAINRSRDSEV
jgi:hypothetical protein